jgi:ZIP family zinc transporter
MIHRGVELIICLFLLVILLYCGYEVYADAQLLFPLLLSFLSGLCTIIGGIIVIAAKSNINANHLAFTCALASAVMLYVSIIDMFLPRVILDPFSSLISALAGASLLFLGLDQLTDAIIERFFQRDKVDLPLYVNAANNCNTPAATLRFGVYTGIVLAIHNFLEGLSVLLSTISNVKLGLTLCIAIGLHNIVEGLLIALPLYSATNNSRETLYATGLSGITEPLAAIIAIVFARDYLTQSVVNLLLCFVAGIMCSLVVKELLPQALRYNKLKALLSGLLVGVLVMLFSGYAVQRSIE